MRMAEHGEVYNPGEAARRLGIAPSTLRIYSVKLADVLSSSAGRPGALPGGRPGVRMYAASDLRVLEQAKELLGRGLTYEQVAAELRPQATGEGAVEGTRRTRRARAVGATELAAVLEPLRAALERADGATAAWERLAEEREAEIQRLRARVAELERALEGGRRGRSWWARLFGG